MQARRALVALAAWMLVAPLGIGLAWAAGEPVVVAGDQPFARSLPPASDLCTDPSIAPLCPIPGVARAGCGAAGLIVRGLLPTQLGNTLDVVTAPAGPQHTENHVVNGGVAPFVETDVVDGICDADASGLPQACGTADASHVAIVVAPVSVSADTLRETTCSSIPADGFSSGDIEDLTVKVVTNIAVPLGVPANTVVPLGGAGFLVLNEQASSFDGTCQHNSGSALRLALLDPLAEVVVGFVATVACKLLPSLGTTSAPTGTGQPLGVQARDTATLAGTGGTPTGSVSFFLCGPAQVTPAGCPTGGGQVGSATAVGGGTALSALGPASTSYGTYCWRAEYDGDDVYVAATHTNSGSECYRVSLMPAIATSALPGAGPFKPSSAVQDRATITGSGPTPTGVVSFYLCAPAQVTGAGCPSGGALVGSASLSGGIATSPATTATSVEGKYCWRAEYAGDGIYTAATHTNALSECFTIAKFNPTISTQATPTGLVFAGTVVRDTATVSGTQGTPTGTVTFFLCKNATLTAGGCTSGGISVGTATLSAGSTTSPGFTLSSSETDGGAWCWRAQYNGDAAYNTATHTNTSSECFDFQPVQ